LNFQTAIPLTKLEAGKFPLRFASIIGISGVQTPQNTLKTTVFQKKQ